MPFLFYFYVLKYKYGDDYVELYYKINVSQAELEEMLESNIVTINKIVIDSANGKYKFDLAIHSLLVRVLRRVHFTTDVVNDRSITIYINSEKLLKNFKIKDKTLIELLYVTNTEYYIASIYSKKEQFRFFLTSIKGLEIDRVIEVNRSQMLKYKFVDFYRSKRKLYIFERFKKSDIRTTYPIYKTCELMGCYIDVRDNESGYMQYFEDIGEPLQDDENNVICLCRENIKQVYDEFKGKGLFVIDYDKFEALVFLHELGHLVFSYIKNNDRELQEKQANYFASLALKGLCDFEIKELSKIQPIEYHNPLLVSYRIKNTKKYEEQVDGLYEGRVVK